MTMELLILMPIMICGANAAIGTGGYNVTMVTDPSTGPYVIGNRIQFSCVVDPLPPEPVTYQWNYVRSIHGRSSSGQNISYTPRIYNDQSYQVRSRWFFCNVLSNGTLIGTGKRLVVYQGFVYTTEPLDRIFVEGEDISLRVNISDRYYREHIQTLTWYRNGTEVITGGRISVRDNGTELHISDMVSSDAGFYQVKVTALDFSIPECDATWLPILTDYTPMLAPVTFAVSLSSRGDRLQYDPTLTLPRSIRHHYVTEETNQIEISEQLTQIDNVTLTVIREHGYTLWYYNGVPVSINNYNGSHEDSLTLSLVINNATKDDIGIYVGVVVVNTHQLYHADSQQRCGSYRRFDYQWYYVFVPVSMVSVELYESPRLLFSSSESQSLNTQDRTVLSCSAIGGNPNDHNFTLSKNNVTLIEGQGTVITYTTSASSYQFGTYTCVVESLYSTSETTLLLQEKAYFELVVHFDDQGQCDEWIEDAQKSTDLIEGIVTIVNSQCGSCNITTENFQEYSFDCSASSFSSALVYSDRQGRVTASSLIQQYLEFLTIEVDGLHVAFTSCIRFQNGHGTLTVCAETCDIQGSVGVLAGTFFGGILTGVLLCLAVLGIGICILKLQKDSPIQETNTSEAEPKEVKLNSNEAYQMVNVCYQSAQQEQQQIQENEPVYEQPAAI